MNEADLKQGLRKVLAATMVGAVVLRLEDKFTGGVPDVCLVWAGTCGWIEVKYERPGRRSVPTAIQEHTLARLRKAGVPAWVLTYSQRHDGAWGVSLDNGRRTFVTSWHTAAACHRWAAEQVSAAMALWYNEMKEEA